MMLASIDDYALAAKKHLKKEIYDFFAGGAQDEMTVTENRLAFNQLQFRPRILTGGFKGALHTKLCSTSTSMPAIIAPTAFHALVHQNGELETALAACDTNTLMVVSMASTYSIESIAKKIKNVGKVFNFWFQVYIQPDKGFTKSIIKSAEELGCKALVITVDSPSFGIRERDVRNGFDKLPNGLFCPNLIADGEKTPRNIMFNSSLNWDDIDWLKSVTKLPIVLKGIMHPEDARIALQHDVSALIVSNHGGRQLDGVAASIHLLPAIAEVVENKIPVIMDGGIRRGTDILKALALGAKAVAIGRPIIWGLAAAGQQGVVDVLDLLHKELLNALNLSGCTSLESISRDILL